MENKDLVYDGDTKSDHSEHYKSCLVILARKAKTKIVSSIQVLCSHAPTMVARWAVNVV